MFLDRLSHFYGVTFVKHWLKGETWDTVGLFPRVTYCDSHANPRHPVSALHIAVCSADQPAQREVLRATLEVDASRNPRVRLLALQMAVLVVHQATNQLRAQLPDTAVEWLRGYSG